MVQTEFAQILADPLELSRRWSREGRKVIGCLDSYIPEEFIHAAGMIPLRILGSTANVTLADSYLPVFAGKLASYPSFLETVTGNQVICQLLVAFNRKPCLQTGWIYILCIDVLRRNLFGSD